MKFLLHAIWPLELNINWIDKLVYILTGSQWLIFLWMDKFNFLHLQRFKPIDFEKD